MVHFKLGNLKEKVRKDCVFCYVLIDNYLLFIRGERKARVDVIGVRTKARVIVGCCRHPRGYLNSLNF